MAANKDLALVAAKERAAILSSGTSLPEVRVEKLQRLAELLEQELFRVEDEQYVNLWLPDVKSVGSGQNAERVDIVRFNSSLVAEYRATLDDIAKETGGRSRGAGDGGNRGEVNFYLDFSGGAQPQPAPTELVIGGTARQIKQAAHENETE